MVFWIGKQTKVLSEAAQDQVIANALVPEEKRYIAKTNIFKKFNIRQSELDTLYNLYLKDLALKKIIDRYTYEDKIYNKKIIKDITQSVDNNQCFFYFLSGMPGSGKSWIAINYGWLYQLAIRKKSMYTEFRWFLNPDSDNPSYINKSVRSKDKIRKGKKSIVRNIYVSYSNSQTNELFMNAPEGSLIIQDESPTQHGKGSKIQKDNLRNLLKVAARKNTISIIIVNPTIFKINDINYYFRLIGHNKENRHSIGFVFDNKMKPLGIIEEKVVASKKLLAKYEKMSKIQKAKIKVKAGQSSSTITEDDLDRLVKLLIKKTTKFGIRKKVQFRNYAALVEQVAGHLYLDLICAEASRRVMHGEGDDLLESFEEIEEIEDVITVNTDLLKPDEFKTFVVSDLESYDLNKLQQDYNILRTDIYIIKYWLEGLTFVEIATLKAIPFSTGTMTTRLRKFRTGHKESINKFCMGQYFERFCSYKLNIPNPAGYTNEADLYDKENKIVYTIKFEYRRKKAKYRYELDFAPEIRKYIEIKDKGFEPKLKLIYYNIAFSPHKIMIVDIDLEGSEEIIIDGKNDIYFE